jgi:all-trans-retinol 13,14-reductase
VLIGTPLIKAQFDSDYDVIVIGSGMGSLATAALLSQKNKKVLVLEAHYTAGGFTHVFSRKGFEWDVGLHYIGDVGRDSAIRRLFDQVTGGELKWSPMDPIYDRIFIEGRSYDLIAGKENFRKRMKEYCPGEASAIDRYLALLSEVKRATGPYFAEKLFSPTLRPLLKPWLSGKFMKFAERTTQEVLDELTSNSELKAVLAGQWGDYGLPPSQSSFAMHALVAAHYLNGGSYPVGGSSSVARSVEKVIRSSGGQIVTLAKVKEVLLERGRAIGVKLENGREIRAPIVVSGVGVKNTFKYLVPDERVPAQVKTQLVRVRSSYSHYCLYLGLRGNAKELGLTSTNLWIYPKADFDSALNEFIENPKTSFPLVFISFPSVKDPNWDSKYPNRSTIEIITLAPYDWFTKWEKTSKGKRDAEYRALKEEVSQRILNILYEHCPQTRGKIEHAELSTPLSTRHFTNYERGEIYGLDHDPHRFTQDWLRPKTSIPGLYLTGQDITSCGVSGALAAGALTASAVLGFRKSSDILSIMRRHR